MSFEPRKPQSTPTSGKHSATSHASSLDESRSTVIQELRGHVPEVEVGWFLENVLPSLPVGVDLVAVQKRLKERGAFNGEGHWALFNNYGYPLSESKAKENAIYANIEGLAQSICKASGAEGKPFAKFVCLPDMTPKALSRPNSAKPDCAALRSGANYELSVKWIDVAVPGEFKTKAADGKLQDNRIKMLWSLAYILREDPRRRFVFGFTIEDVSMRLWFCSRSDVLVSKPFDFMEDHYSTIHFFLSISYASYSQLGWDPSIAFVRQPALGGNVTLDITVRNSSTGVETTYRTRRLLSNIGADAVKGRGTRVWEVRELDSEGKERSTPLVLKDVWIDSDRKSEGAILYAVHSKDGVPEDVREMLDKFFVHVENEGNVYVDGVPDHTRNVMLKGHTLPEDLDRVFVPADLRGRPMVGSAHLDVQGSAAVAPAENEPEPPPPYAGKYHYRIVYKELGKTIRQVSSLSEAFGHLSDVVTGLQVLYERGWIHRDISVGNILVVEIGRDAEKKVIREVKISDVEYAKEVDNTEPAHSLRTGTIYFMSTEVESHRYLYWKDKVQARPSAASNWRDRTARRLDKGKAPAVRSRTPPPKSTKDPLKNANFRHNPIHDIEDPKGSEKEHNAYMRAQRKLSYELFCNPVFRREVMAGDGLLTQGSANLYPQVGRAILMLDEVRKQIVQFYREAEENLHEEPHEPNLQKLEELYAAVSDRLAEISVMLAAKDLKIWKFRLAGKERTRLAKPGANPPGPPRMTIPATAP